MSKSILISDEVVISKIHLIRGQKVMIDRDLAELYGVETRVLKQAVRRNIERFPEDFMFEMNKAQVPPSPNPRLEDSRQLTPYMRVE